MPNGLPPDVDDNTIGDEERLYRRIHPTHPPLQRTNVPGVYRPASGALKDSEWPLSVDLGSLSTPEQTRDRCTTTPFHVAGFTAAMARRYGCRIVRDPLPENPAHALIFGDHDNGSGALNKSQFKGIANEARIILLNPLAPPPVQEEPGSGG